MRNATYRDIPALITRREPFRGNSASAHWVNGDYIVLSYDTVIAKWTTGAGWNISDMCYSRTTSRLQNIVRKVA